MGKPIPVIVAIAVACIACRDKPREVRPDDATHAPKDASADANAGATLTFSFGSTPTPAPYGVAVAMGTKDPPYELRFFAKPTSCEEARVARDVASFTLAPPATQALVRGGAVGVALVVDDRFVTNEHQSSARFDPATVVEGGHVKGTLAFERTPLDLGVWRASGSFDLLMCAGERIALDDPPTKTFAPPGPFDPPAHAIDGNLGGVPFAPESVVAVVAHDDAIDRDYVEEIHFLAEPGLDCALWASAGKRQKHVAAVHVAGGAANQGFLGTPQTIEGAWRGPDERPFTFEFPDWIVFRTFTTTIGATIEGTISLAYGTEAMTAKGAGRVEGNFTAIVCRAP